MLAGEAIPMLFVKSVSTLATSLHCVVDKDVRMKALWIRSVFVGTRY